MKIIISSIVALIITTIVFAQSLEKESGKLAAAIEHIKKEIIGGKLDFRSVLKESDEVIVHNGVGFNKNDYYVFLWGQSVGEMGLESSDKAARLWEQIHGQKLTNPQRTALRIGFEKKL